MTDKELKDLIASLALDRKEWAKERKAEALAREKERKEREKERKEREKDNKELTALHKETEIAMKKMSESIERLNKETSGLGSNAGHHAEQFFQNVFAEKLKFGYIKYDKMIPNLTHNGKEKMEFDIALVNGNSIALIEVKNRIHPRFVDEFAEDRIKKFRKYWPEFQDYTAYLGIAGFSFDEEVIARASRYGIGIIGQKGDSVEVKGKLKAY